jgi:acyl-CoA thioester hydrolase
LRPKPHARNAYAWVLPLPTRWADNDLYGHINNAAYYGFFDTAVNTFLIEKAGLDIHHGQQIGLVVKTECSYFAPLAFPATLDIGVRAERIGRSSITYGLGVFGKDDALASAQGIFIHVYVDRQRRKPVPLGDSLRKAAEAIAGGQK